MPATNVGSGVPSLDQVLGGGLLEGDNVVWIVTDAAVYGVIEEAFLASCAGSRPTVFVACGRSGMRRRLPPGVRRLNAGEGARLAQPTALSAALDELMAREPAMAIVVDDFDELVNRWGSDTARRFFARACPSMLQAGAITYWRAGADTAPAVLDACRQITQCTLELTSRHLRVLKAEGRARSLQGAVHDVEHGDGSVRFVANSTSGRLARGLVRLRRDLGLTQAELAAAAGVTPSAMSQAESGSRGLAVDTLITLSDRLGVSVDRIVNGQPEPGYRLTRHDRVPRRRGAVPLVDDAAVGLRAFYVALAAGERGEPPSAPGSPQLVAVVAGLVQVELGGDTPVLRSGDTLLVETLTIGWWLNLAEEPGGLYWIVREELRTPRR